MLLKASHNYFLVFYKVYSLVFYSLVFYKVYSLLLSYTIDDKILWYLYL